MSPPEHSQSKLEQADIVQLLAPDRSPKAWSQVLLISLRQSDESQSDKNSILKCSHPPNNFDCRVFIILRAGDNCLPIWTDFNSDVARLHHSQGLPISDVTALPDATRVDTGPALIVALRKGILWYQILVTTLPEVPAPELGVTSPATSKNTSPSIMRAAVKSLHARR